MAKRWIVEKHDEAQTGTWFNRLSGSTHIVSHTVVHQVGAPCKTGTKAINLKARMRKIQPLGSSAWFTIRQITN